MYKIIYLIIWCLVGKGPNPRSIPPDGMSLGIKLFIWSYGMANI